MFYKYTLYIWHKTIFTWSVYQNTLQGLQEQDAASQPPADNQTSQGDETEYETLDGATVTRGQINVYDSLGNWIYKDKFILDL